MHIFVKNEAMVAYVKFLIFMGYSCVVSSCSLVQVKCDFNVILVLKYSSSPFNINL